MWVSPAHGTRGADASTPWLQPADEEQATSGTSLGALGAPPAERSAELEAGSSMAVLAQTNAVAQSSIETGATILSDLGGQRDQLLHMRGTLHETGGNLGRSSRLIREMFRRARCTKVTLLAIVFLLVGIILLLLYAKLRRAMS